MRFRVESNIGALPGVPGARQPGPSWQGKDRRAPRERGAAWPRRSWGFGGLEGPGGWEERTRDPRKRRSSGGEFTSAERGGFGGRFCGGKKGGGAAKPPRIDSNGAERDRTVGLLNGTLPTDTAFSAARRSALHRFALVLLGARRGRAPSCLGLAESLRAKFELSQGTDAEASAQSQARFAGLQERT